MSSPPKTSIHLNFGDGPTNEDKRNLSPKEGSGDKSNKLLENKKTNFDLRNHSVINDHEFKKYEKLYYDKRLLKEAAPEMNYKEMRIQNNLKINLPFSDHKLAVPGYGTNNEEMNRIYQDSKRFEARQPSTKTYDTNIKIKVNTKRDSFYNNGGTYKSIFNENSAQIDAEKMIAEK